MLTATALAQNNFAFDSGEELVFTMSYAAKVWPNTDMGSTTFKVSDSSAGSTPAYLINCVSATNRFFGTFYKMRDQYDTWIAKSDLRPLLSKCTKREGSYRFHSTIEYDWNAGVARTRFRNEDWPEDQKKELPITRNSVDAMNLLYSIRSQDPQKWLTGAEQTIELVSENKVERVHYRYRSTEKIKVAGLGTTKAYKIVCQMIDDELKLEEGEKAEFYVWISADRNLVPLMMKTPTKIGTIKVRLSSFKGLKYGDELKFE